MPKRKDTGNRKQSTPQDGIFNGMSAPLWSNPAVQFFKAQYYQSQVQGFIFGVIQSFVLGDGEDCEQMPLQVISGINNYLVYGFAIVNLMYQNLEYATDCEWFKQIMFLLLVNIIQTLVLLVTLFQLYMNWIGIGNCTGQHIFQNHIAIALMVNVVGISVLLIQSYLTLFLIYVKFYITNDVDKFQYKQIREVMLLD